MVMSLLLALLRIRKGVRPVVFAAVVAATAAGWLFTRGGGYDDVVLPFDSAGPADTAPDSPADSPPPDSPPDTPASAPRLIVLLGQSNGAGLCVAANVGLASTDSRVSMIEHTAGAGPADPPSFTDEGPRVLGPRLVSFGGSFAIGTGGVELQMGRYLADNRPSDTWYYGKMAIDGSSLINHWANASYPSSGGNMLARTIAFVDAQMARWSITDAPNNLIFVWIQGEADGGAAYATYLAALHTYFDALRANYGNVRILFNRTIDVVDVAANVRAAQEAYAVGTSGCGIVGHDEYTLRDTAHYSDQSYKDLGNALGAKLVELLTGSTPTAPYYVATGPISVTNSAGSLTPTIPPHQAGDIVVAFLAGSGQNSYTLSTANGFAAVPDSPQHDSGSGLNARVQAWWVRADQTTMDANGGQMPSPVIGDVAGDGSKIAAAIVIRGAAASGSPFDVTAGDTTATSTSVAAPGDTTTTANALVLGIVGANVDTTTPQFADWSNGDLAELAGQVNYSTNNGAGVTLGVFTGRKVAAGAFGATTSTLSTSSTQARLTLVVKP